MSITENRKSNLHTHRNTGLLSRMNAVSEVLKNSLMITGFVFVMMLAVEYLNILTQGRITVGLEKRKHTQVGLAALLGALPGCLGSFASVSLYAHRLLSFGAILATMIATSGDEAFLMLALFPQQAFLLFGILFLLGMTAGTVADLGGKNGRKTAEPCQIVHTENHACVGFSKTEFISQWKNLSAHRGWLTLLLLGFLAGVISGKIGHTHLGVDTDHAPKIEQHDDCSAHDHEARQHGAGTACGTDSDHDHAHCEGWGWVRITLLAVSLIGLFIVITVPEHFLEKHLWNHLVKKHIWVIFLWTTGALLATHLLITNLHLENLIRQNRFIVLLIACLVGLIPQSGPHLIFVTFFAEGLIPFSTLLASCIVQDGHGSIPLLAHSRIDFLKVKTVNFLLGLLAGTLGLLFLK